LAKKLRCDRCGFELTDKDDIDIAFEGMAAWQASARARGIEPRGVLPCKNYVRCGGEIVEVNEKGHGRLSKLFGRSKDKGIQEQV
jgi:hypothetical protein